MTRGELWEMIGRVEVGRGEGEERHKQHCKRMLKVMFLI